MCSSGINVSSVVFKNYEAVWKSDVESYCKILPCGIYDKFVYDHEHINLTN